jgi:thioredoxin-dependent peroxiredoxin
MREGQLAPDFILPDQDATMRRLSDLLADGPVVLFFYPAAMTSGCTREACHFRDLGAQFRAAGVQRVGISCDPPERQTEFARRHGFDYPLLSDTDGAVAAMFGVQRGQLVRRLGVPVKRTTFVIGPDRTVRKVIRSELNMNAHADEALASLAAHT